MLIIVFASEFGLGWGEEARIIAVKKGPQKQNTATWIGFSRVFVQQIGTILSRPQQKRERGKNVSQTANGLVLFKDARDDKIDRFLHSTEALTDV